MLCVNNMKGLIMKKFLEKKWLILIVLIILWTIFTIVYVICFITVPQNSTKTFEVVKFIFLSISAFGIIFSVLLSSYNSLEASKNVQDRIEFDRIENSFEFMHRWDSPSLKEARDYTRKIKKEKDKFSPEELLKRIEGPYKEENEIEKQESLKRSIITMFNYFEEIKLSIDHNRVHGEVLKKALREVYLDIFERFQPWLKKRNLESQLKLLEELRNKWI